MPNPSAPAPAPIAPAPESCPSAPAPRPAAARPFLLVSAAVLVEGRRVLVTQRKQGTHLAGAWEFPGGKVEPDEDPREALARELREEVGIDVLVGAPVEVTFHRYPTKSVLLLFFEARRAPGSPDPTPLDVADVRWAAEADLRDDLFPPADVSILAKVRARLAASPACAT